MRRLRFRYKETIVTILTERDDYYRTAIEAILKARSEIEDYIFHNPDFFTSYEPIDCSGGEVVNRMCRAAKIAGVGPMAAVAGTIAGYAVEKMIEAGAELAVVDNGGDIVIHSDRKLLVGIYPSTLAFKVPPVDYLAICTSSGKIGHSVSFGKADAATVVARDASIADALATALGNIIGDFGKKELEKTVSRFYKDYSDFAEGVLVIKDDLVALAGKLPPLVSAESREDLITKG